MKDSVKQWVIFLLSMICFGVISAIGFLWLYQSLDNNSLNAEYGENSEYIEPPTVTGTAVFVNGDVVTGTSIGIKHITPPPKPTTTPNTTTQWFDHNEEDTDISNLEE